MNNTLGLEWSWINFHSTRDSIITTQYYSSFFYWLDYGLDYVKKLHLMSSKYPLVAYITCTRFKTQFYPIKYRINKITRLQTRKHTYKRKSCSQHGLAPFTVTVVDFTFCSFSVTYELNCSAEIVANRSWIVSTAT